MHLDRYSYVARDERGKVVKGILSAESEIDLANKIRNMGYFLTKASLYREKKAGGRVGSIKGKDLLTFTIHLATLVEAGIPLVEGLRDLSRNAEKEDAGKLIDDLRYRVESGSSLKEALSMHPGSFNSLYLALIGAGEATGKLVFALESLSVFLEWQMDLKSKIKEAMTYPILLSIAMVGVVTLLMVKVVPIFKPMFNQVGTELPFTTQMVINASDFIKHYFILLLFVPVLLIVGYKIIYSKPQGKYMFDSLKLKMPIFGDLIHKIALSRFCHILSLSLQSGVNILGALDISISAMGNSRLEASTKRARDSINLGEKIATSLEVTGDFPPLIIRMIGVGEESGTLANSLNKVSQFYDKEIPRTINRIFTLFEPIMIITMGFVVGFIAISIFMPMFKLAQSLD